MAPADCPPSPSARLLARTCGRSRLRPAPVDEITGATQDASPTVATALVDRCETNPFLGSRGANDLGITSYVQPSGACPGDHVVWHRRPAHHRDGIPASHPDVRRGRLRPGLADETADATQDASPAVVTALVDRCETNPLRGSHGANRLSIRSYALAGASRHPVRIMRARNIASVSDSCGQIKRVPSVEEPVSGWGKGSRRNEVCSARKLRTTCWVSPRVRVQTE
jgi:hypothetical protein